MSYSKPIDGYNDHSEFPRGIVETQHDGSGSLLVTLTETERWFVTGILISELGSPAVPVEVALEPDTKSVAANSFNTGVPAYFKCTGPEAGESGECPVGIDCRGGGLRLRIQNGSASSYITLFYVKLD